jgi:threonylcarbamoyladenosine tRNA methylthiotransferase CDKAL1
MKKFYLETYGCKLNQSDSDLIRGILSKKFKEVFFPKEADFIVINSCGVVEKTERKIIKRIKSFKNKKIILTGCLPLILPEISRKIALGLLGPQNILSIEKAADNILRGKKFFEVLKKETDKSEYCFLKKRKDNEISAIVSIGEGCLGNCNYCAAKYARGRLKSFKIKNILKEIEILVKLGYKEIQLTSQDSSVFGLDKGKYLLPELLKKICKIKGNFKIRVGMMNPGSAKIILKDLIPIFKSEKIYKFLHLPLQSGEDKVLKLMNRSYKTGDFLKIINEFKKNFKNFLIATDVIVGYPGEDEKAFLKTVRIIDEIKPEILHIFRFSKRKNTLAERIKDFPDKIKKERSRILTGVFYKNNLKENEKFLGKIIPVLVTERRKNNTFLARTNSFRAVVLKKVEPGEILKVRISGFKKNFLIGKKIRTNNLLDCN